MSVHPYSALAPEYTALLQAMKVTRQTEVNATADRLLRLMPHYRPVSAKTGVPAAMIAVLHERESGADFRTGLGQGDPWNKVSVHVPKGYGPFSSWEEAAIFYLHYDHMDDNSVPWSMPYACWKGEVWNGFGPRNHGRHTGYLWSGTNIYTGGKYVADGVWDPSAQDKQIGIVPVMLRMMALDPSLAFGVPQPVVEAPSIVPAPQPLPVGVGGGDFDTRGIQRALNTLGQSPALVVDGSYGRRTREAVRAFQVKHNLKADGLVGPVTKAALTAALAAA